MIRRLVIPILAVAGLIFGIYMMYRGTLKPPITPFIVNPPESPYECSIAAEGVIESGGENHTIGVPFSEVTTNVYVHVGDTVTHGQPLFKLDTRQPEADRDAARADARVAMIDAANAVQQFSYYTRLMDKNAVSRSSYTQAYYIAYKAIAQMRAALAKVRSFETIIERSIIRAPFDGIVLQDGIHEGEAVNTNPFNRPPFLILGTTKYWQLRIDIAEEDAWRYKKGSRARAFVRGNPTLFFDLTYDYYEPLIVPKHTLTGSDIELVDTRVLQVVYRFEKGEFPLYVGQLLDVYIESDKKVSPHE